MFEEKLNDLYGEIVGKMCSMIPCEYENIHFLGRMSDDGGSVRFYFNTKEKDDEYIDSLDITEKFNVSEEIFNKLDDELYDLTRELYNTFVENGQEAWICVIMHYDKNGKFELEYNYIDWFEKGYTQMDIISYFEYKYLNIMPYGGERYLKVMKKMESIELEQANGD